MIIINDEKIAEKARSLKNLSFPKGKRIYKHQDVGYNYRMTNIQAAIGLAQLEKIDELVERRRKNAHLYNELLKGVEGIALPVEKEWVKNVYWMYSILIEEEFGMSRDKIMDKLEEKGIETRPFFVPIHQQPVFHKMGWYEDENYPITERLAITGINLPSSSGLKEEEIRYICDVIKSIKEDLK